MFSVPAALFFPHSPSFLLVILLVLAIKVLSGDSFKHITSKCSLFSKVVPSVINRFHPPSSSHESEAFIVLFFQFVSSLSSLFLFFLLLSVLRSHRGHRQQRVVDLLSVRRPRAVSQQLLDGDPVVEDAAIPLLHALLLAQ